MNPIFRRGYHGKRYRVYDHENECYFDLSADEFQVALWRSEKQQAEVRENVGTSGNHAAMSEVQQRHVF